MVNKVIAFKVDNRLKLILLFALLNSSLFLSVGGSGILRFFIAALMNISGVLLAITFVKKTRAFSAFKISYYFRLLIVLLLLWSLITLFRSLEPDGQTIITLFGHYLMGWAWLTPMAIVFGFNIHNWPNIFTFLSRVLLIAVILGVFALYYPVSYNIGLLECFSLLPLLVLSFFYQRKGIKKIIILSIPVYLLVSLGVSQRVHYIVLIIILGFTFLQYIKESKFKLSKGIVLFLIFLLGTTFVLGNFTKIVNTFTKNKELSTDTRTFLFQELYLDLSKEELIYGRGALGTYYSPYFEHIDNLGLEGDSSVRSVNEVGYLEMILKGGYIMMALYILILLPAAYLGIFRSKNFITRMCGYFILIYLIIWSISFYPVYSAEYILLWMAAGTVISKKNRMFTNDDLTIGVNQI